MVGRKPKPDGERIRRNKRPAAGPEPALQLGDAPEWLGPVARAEWDRLVPGMREAGGAGGWDRAVVVAYCVAVERWTVAEQKVQAQGQVIDVGNRKARNPFVGVANESLMLMARLAAELRLTPVSRTRAPLPAKAAGGGKLEQFLPRLLAGGKKA